MPERTAGVDDSDGPHDEITIDPLPMLHIPIPRVVTVIAGRIPRGRLLGNGRHPTWQGWLLGATAAVVVIGALKLSGVIWTSAPPKWVTTLGAGVTVTGPEQLAPGHGSPGAALTGLIAALSSKGTATFCDYIYMPPGAQCTAASSQGSRDQLSVKIGYVAIAGTHALVGFTGKVCTPSVRSHSGCVTNTDPAAIFSAGNTFAALWAQTARPNSVAVSSYRLQPCVEVGGKWYVGSGPA